MLQHGEQVITALFRPESVQRNSRNEINAFYMALCNDDDKWAANAAKGLVGSAAAAAEGFVVELLDEFYSMYTNQVYAPSPQEIAQRATFIDALFARVATVDQEAAGSVMGVYPNCAAPSVAQADVGKIFKPSGWEAIKCLLAKTQVAVFNPVAFYKGNRCTIWKFVISAGISAVNTAIWLLIASNPLSLTGAVVLRATLSTGFIGRAFYKYIMELGKKHMFKSGRVLTAAAGKATEEVYAKNGKYLRGFIAGRLQDMSSTIVHILINVGWHVGQPAEASVLTDPTWTDCLIDYFKFAIMTILGIINTLLGDPTTFLTMYIKSVLLQAVGCSTSTSSFSFNKIRSQCLPFNSNKASNGGAKQAYEDQLDKFSEQVAKAAATGECAPPTPGADFGADDCATADGTTPPTTQAKDGAEGCAPGSAVTVQGFAATPIVFKPAPTPNTNEPSNDEPSDDVYGGVYGGAGAGAAVVEYRAGGSLTLKQVEGGTFVIASKGQVLYEIRKNALPFGTFTWKRTLPPSSNDVGGGKRRGRRRLLFLGGGDDDDDDNDPGTYNNDGDDGGGFGGDDYGDDYGDDTPPTPTRPPPTRPPTRPPLTRPPLTTKATPAPQADDDDGYDGDYVGGDGAGLDNDYSQPQTTQTPTKPAQSCSGTCIDANSRVCVGGNALTGLCRASQFQDIRCCRSGVSEPKATPAPQDDDDGDDGDDADDWNLDDDGKCCYAFGGLAYIIYTLAE